MGTHHNKSVSYTRDPMKQTNMQILQPHVSRTNNAEPRRQKNEQTTIGTEPPPACIHPTHGDLHADTRPQCQLLHWSHDGSRTARRTIETHLMQAMCRRGSASTHALMTPFFNPTKPTICVSCILITREDGFGHATNLICGDFWVIRDMV